MIYFERHWKFGAQWTCMFAGQEVFAWFWAQVAIWACLYALHVGEIVKAEVLPMIPPWEHPRWWQAS